MRSLRLLQIVWLFQIVVIFSIVLLAMHSLRLTSGMQLTSVLIRDPRQTKLFTSSSSSPLRMNLWSSVLFLSTTMILVFLVFNSNPFSLLRCCMRVKSSTRSSLLSHSNVVSSAYLKLLIFLPPIVIPALVFSVASLMMFSEYILNSEGDTMQPCLTPRSIENHSDVPQLVLTAASWFLYRCSSSSITCTGKPILCMSCHSS